MSVLSHPYDGENKGKQGCECIVCKESHHMYAWILFCCAEMEPAFDLSIKIDVSN